MAIFTSLNFNNPGNILAPHSAGEVMMMEDVVSLPDTLAQNDIIKLGYLPAGCTPVDLTGFVEELDTAGSDTLRITIGLLNADGDGIISGSELVSNLQAEADKVFRGNAAGLNGLAVDKINNRVIAGKVTAAGTTKAAGTLRAKLLYCAV